MYTKAYAYSECLKIRILSTEVKEGLPCWEILEERKNIKTDSRGTHIAFAVTVAGLDIANHFLPKPSMQPPDFGNFYSSCLGFFFPLILDSQLQVHKFLYLFSQVPEEGVQDHSHR